MSAAKVHVDLNAEHVRQGATCKALREKSRLKLGEAANALDVSYSYLSNIEAGRKPITAVMLAKLAHLYDVPELAIRQPDVYERISA